MTEISAGDTSTSVPCMLTAAGTRNILDAFKEYSLISVLRNKGFHTSWISNQGYLGRVPIPGYCDRQGIGIFVLQQ